jgi:type III restriction enzyme
VEVTPQLAKQIYKYLLKNDYTDDADRITERLPRGEEQGERLAELPPELQPYAEQVFQLIDSVFSDSQLPQIDDDRKPKKNPLNATSTSRSSRRCGAASTARRPIACSSTPRNWSQQGIKARSNQRAARHAAAVHDSARRAEGRDGYDDDASSRARLSCSRRRRPRRTAHSVHSAVKYDLIGKLAEGTQLTRRTVADILKG